jgi:DNA mismatch repair ATPase MutS
MNTVDKKILTDLEIDNKLIPLLNNTITTYGKLKFNELFNITYSNPNNLKRRREIIELIIRNPKNTKKIITELKKIKKYEKKVRWLFNDLGKEYKDLYFSKEFMNNEDLLSITNFLKTYSPSLIILVYFLIYIVLRQYGLNIDLKSYIVNIYENYKRFIMGILGLLIKNINFISFLTNFFATLYLLYQIYSIYNSIEVSVNHYHKCSGFNKNIYNIRNLIDSIKNIYKLDKFFIIEKKMVLCNIKKIDKKFDTTRISKFGYNLLTKIKTSEYENIFNSVLQYVGLIDSFINISKLVTVNGFTFPQFDYSKENGPYIKANGLWNPNINKLEQIKNDCDLGTPNTIILSGPNTSGKSTYIRTIMLAVFLSQTIGVTCCENLIFTPFNYLFTYLDIPNISRDKESLFEAEILRCMEYCNILETTNINEYVFTIIDELFTATNPREGIAASYSVCEYIGKSENSLNIITTHFNEVTDLEKVNPKNFKNMKFNVIKNTDGTFYRPYKIQPGKSDQHIAIELLKNKGYDNQIITRAIEKLKNL